MNRRNTHKLPPGLFTWLSNLSVGLVVGGILALLLSTNPWGLSTIYIGTVIAIGLFGQSGEHNNEP